ncbi:MAG: AAA family ATPase [Planctomycetota bacterium]|nr:AAA family ATPase [Planctomycetota bacterium]
MRTIAIINQKGGCGKTTTAINLGAMLARRGRRVLLVDMDPQSHCAAGLGIPESRLELDIGDAMLGAGSRPLDISRLLWRVARNLDLAPSRMKLAGLEASRGGLAELPDRERRLASVLHEFRHDYDVVCIDCPPSIGLLTYNALAASDTVLIPVETSYFSLQGATRQVNTVRTLSRRLGVQLPVWVLATIHDPDNAVAGDLLDELHRRFKGRVVPPVIRRDVALREAASHGQAIVDYAPHAPGAHDYNALARWAIEHLEGRVEPDAIDGAEHDGGVPEVHVPPVSPRVLATGARPGPDAHPEPGAEQSTPDLKPVSRAEDVARRAQEFLRRVATGGRTAPATGEALAESAPESGLRGGVPLPDVAPASAGSTAGAMVADAPRASSVLRLVPDAPTPVRRPSPDAARLLGVRVTNQGVLFVQPGTSGQRVAVAGSFNNWSPTAHPMSLNADLGVFELCLRLPPGAHRYRLVIDGQWSADPHNNHCEPNPFGEADSVIVVSDAAARAS